MSAFANHFSFEFRTGIRNKTLLLMNYLFPLGFYLMMGFVMPTINPLFLESMIPAMVVFAILAATLLGIPDPLVNARETGVFRSYKINGVPSVSILTIPALTTMLHLVVVAVLITATAPLLFDAPLPENWVNYVLVFVAMAIACAGLGVLIGVISSSTRMTVLWSQLIFIPSMLLGGLMIPYSMLPEAIGKISQLLPATQAMNASAAWPWVRRRISHPGARSSSSLSAACWSLGWRSISSVGTAATPRGAGTPCWDCWLSCPTWSGSFCWANVASDVKRQTKAR